MSHITKIGIRVKSISALKAVCAQMGLELIKEGESRSYYESAKRDYVIKLKGRYDVGLTLQKNGTYELDADLWGGDVVKEVGENCGTLLQKYGEAAVKEAARRKGMSVYMEDLLNGDVKLTVVSYA